MVRRIDKVRKLKIYCDKCEKEITDSNVDVLFIRKFWFSNSRKKPGKEDTKYYGDYCKECWSKITAFLASMNAKIDYGEHDPPPVL